MSTHSILAAMGIIETKSKKPNRNDPVCCTHGHGHLPCGVLSRAAPVYPYGEVAIDVCEPEIARAVASWPTFAVQWRLVDDDDILIEYSRRRNCEAWSEGAAARPAPNRASGEGRAIPGGTAHPKPARRQGLRIK